METNKKLMNLFKLGCKVAIYVPSTVEIDKKTDNSKQVDSMLSNFSDMFGGATSTKAVGAWKTSTSLIKEEITLVFSYCTSEQLENNIGNVIILAENLKRDMSQEAISLEINNELYFI